MTNKLIEAADALAEAIEAAQLEDTSDRLFDALTAYRAARESAGEVPEYTYDMGVAGDEYIRSVAYEGSHTLPVMFRWRDLWNALNAAL